MSLLSVTVKKARYVGIQAQQYNSYVTLKLQHVKSTTVTVKGPNPCWEQDFLFETNDVNTGLIVEVWIKGMIWDRALGYYYIPLRDVQYSNEEGSGQWFMLDGELIMRDGEVVGTKNPTGDSLLLDCRFELPFGSFDPPSGWKCLLEPDPEMRSGPRSLGDEDNTDWLPLARQNLPDHWSGRDAENSMEDALQRKLERLNRTIFGQEEQTKWPMYYSGYSEDSDYTSDLNYPVGQHPNSSASHFKRAAQHMRTPDTSLETSRENSSETDDGPVQGRLKPSYGIKINHSSQQGMVTKNYKKQQEYRNYNETDGEPLYYNSRPRNYKEYSSQKWYYPPADYEDNSAEINTPNNKKGGRRPSLERQTTLYDDQYYSDEQYFDGTDKQQSQSNTAQNYEEYYDQDYGYQNESYGEEEEDKQWDSGGYYYSSDYTISSTNNYQNVLNENRSSKNLPATAYSNSVQNQTYYTQTRDKSYENESVAYNPTLSAATKRRLLKQQHQSSDEYSSTMDWPSDDNATVWQSAEDYSYYEDYSNSTSKAIPPPVMTPSHRPKKRMLPLIRATSRNRASVVSLPQTPNRKLPKPPTSGSRRKVGVPISRTTSADNDRNGMYDAGAFNENYNYAYASNDNLQTDKFSDYPNDMRTSINYQESYESTLPYINDYQNKENCPESIQEYTPDTNTYQNGRNVNNYVKPQRDQDYLSDFYPEDSLESSFENDLTQGLAQKPFAERRINSPFTQQNTDSLESRDDELRDESFETAVDSICSSVTVQKQSTDYSSFDTSYDCKPDSLKQQQYQQQQQQQLQYQQQQQQQQLQYQQQQLRQQQQQNNQQQQQQPTSVLGNILGSLTRSPSHYQQQDQQQQKSGQRSRDQSNLLSNPALAAMNVTKGIFSSITNVVNNTVQNINKQQQQNQQKTQQQQENHVQRIQVTKRGSLKQQETIESVASYSSRQNSFESQMMHESTIPEEPENYINEKEEEYYNQGDEYYEYDDKEFYERDEDNYNQRSVDDGVDVSDMNQRNESESISLSKRNNFRHQDTVESEGKRPEVKSRSYLRQQDSVDSGAEEMLLGNDHRGSPTVADRYEDTRAGSIEHSEANHLDISRKRGSGHDNSLIEPYHPNWTGSEVQKSYSGSPPVMQKQQSVDLEGIEEEEVPAKPCSLPTLPEEDKVAPEPEQEETKKSVVPERRKMTAKERWHRAYNVVVQRLNVTPKAVTAARAISQLLPNLRGPQLNIRLLYIKMVLSMILYGAPIWAQELTSLRPNLREVERLRRVLSFRVCRGYRTISGAAAGLLARIPPIDLQALSQQRLYLDRAQLRSAGAEITPERRRLMKDVESRRILADWQRRLPSPADPGATPLLSAIREHFLLWTSQEHGELTFRTTQILTGHGCFGKYLHAIQREDSPRCHHCPFPVDSSMHTLVECAAWNAQRERLKATIAPDLSLHAVIAAMVTSKRHWDAFTAFSSDVMLKKENAERERKRRDHNPAAADDADRRGRRVYHRRRRGG